eukprot:1890224-Pleurochrysis_carterae.AAC.3
MKEGTQGCARQYEEGSQCHHAHLDEGANHESHGEVSLERNAVADASDLACPVAREQRRQRVELRVVEGRVAQDVDRTARQHVFPAKQLEERRFAGTVGANEQATHAAFELEGDAVQRGGLGARVPPREVVHSDGGPALGDDVAARGRRSRRDERTVARHLLEQHPLHRAEEAAPPAQAHLFRYLEQVDRHLDRLAEDHLTAGQVGDVCRPAIQAIENMRAVDGAHTALFALLAKELEQVLPCEQVEVSGDLIEQQHLARLDQLAQNLHAPALPIRNSREVPLFVNLE